ncbi:Rpn family recombination-promoting nuclease/putative transposase [Brachyspira hyodysenteriae]|uniref:Rpn family recombination-promoting nuclease/putative transposase n=1 Tax=Brachyspira hyodysenteriae TaxID=159 RepID=UPI0022CDA86C|nr:Rpn family recombination-promoting nuclease/putative transposase [Brachyspira hyodysenteriae]MCZ9840438.1 Rpn family recombination-promoting nuclease/putative transposase [Brachyspira hyodysenteriae]MCZ9848825.1 Rpn family recombination-promoting nuclease/putative transposase [Brachyspira hyodysenteriae]MCZ9852306.1 Rpn family recombination-promoting nuclease/putative transposase [Brachyspira hyodysenteriae]MCZ9861929.1 Rpn family recombination-promoting nuclease/putative transposase [Brachy
MKEINRLNDLFVRYLIGKQGDEDILENIVNAVLNDAGFESVSNLEIINPYNLPENENLKESILDVKAKTKDGKKILIEIQLVGNNNFIKRILYYIAKNIASELKESNLYINISKMISISFINFNLDIGSETDIRKEHKCFTFADIYNPTLRLDDFQIHFIEIKRFAEILKNTSIDDYNKNKLLSWIDFFTTKDLEKDIDKLIGGNDIMPKVIDKYKRFVADEKEMSAYNERDTFLYGQAAMLQYEREAGKKEGIEIGFQKGIEQGIEQGEINRAKIIALNLKNMNMNNEDISRITGLTIEEINKL